MNIIKIVLSYIWQHKKAIIKGYFWYIGLIGFTCFMLEESIQCFQFASWQIEKDGTPLTLKECSDSILYTNKVLAVVNKFGIANPFGYIAYREYGKASKMYAEALQNKAFAREPSLYKDQVIRFSFKPNVISGNIGINGVVKVEFKQIPVINQSVHVTGIVTILNNEVVIKEI